MKYTFVSLNVNKNTKCNKYVSIFSFSSIQNKTRYADIKHVVHGIYYYTDYSNLYTIEFIYGEKQKKYLIKI